MAESSGLSDEARRTAIEVIASVPWYRRTLIDRILGPAGAPRELCLRHLNRIDELTGRKISKRAAAPDILAEMEARGEGERFVRSVIEIGAGWTDFHLHEREMEARAAVEKAKAFLTHLKSMEAEERTRQEHQRHEEKRRRQQEEAEQFRRGRDLLKMELDALY